MATALWPRFGYDPEKARREAEARLAAEKAAQEARLAAAKAAQHDAIKSHRFYIRPIDEFDFPKTEKGKSACKEIASDLKGINKAIELGLNYSQFSNLLTKKALAVEKTKDLQGDGIPRVFFRRVDACVDAYKQSRDWWHKQIENAEHPSMIPYEDYVMREYWAEAGVDLTYCIGIAECDTNANATAIDLVASMIRTEQNGVRDGTLAAKDYLDPSVYNLSVDQISDRLKATLTVTNAP
jgi:hypothetical protein